VGLKGLMIRPLLRCAHQCVDRQAGYYNTHLEVDATAESADCQIDDSHDADGDVHADM